MTFYYFFSCSSYVGKVTFTGNSGVDTDSDGNTYQEVSLRRSSGPGSGTCITKGKRSFFHI